jgi:4-amino-4-deoxy-L-arabinose transferase-like glycosyltransferase
VSTATLTRVPPLVRRVPERRPSRARAVFASAWLWLPLLLAGQAALALRPGLNETAFDDEGLYVFMGHRMIEHLLHGAVLQESPGSYFSGAPGLYPVLAAMADSVGGLQAARGVSLAFAMLATVGTYGLGARLFGRLAGLLGALAFVLCGSIIFQSHLATFDSMTTALVAVAAWFAVRSAQRDGLLWAPVVGALLALAALTKYAGAVYAPMVVALAVTVGWRQFRWLIVRRAAFTLIAAGVVFAFIIQLWGQELVHGITQTTGSRAVIRSASASFLLGQIALWVGPWLALAAFGGLFRLRREWATVAVLLIAAVIGPVEQARIGEAVSLSKHVGFGMVFAAPLIGDLFARALRRLWWVAAVPVAAAYVALAALGLHFSGQFLTGWVDDRPLRPVVLNAMAASPGSAILGEQPSAMRYELRDAIGPRQWYDTYEISFGGLQGKEAYSAALHAHHFGVIYLSLTTDNGAYVLNELTRADRDRYYHIVDKVPRMLRGERVGEWLVFAPQSVPSTPAASQ